jgi:replicative DNA helicase
MGSTALSINIAEHTALKERLHVAIFSMGAEPLELASRLVGSVSRIEWERVRCGKLSDDEWSRLATAAERLRNAPLHIHGTPGLSSREVCSNARRLALQFGKLGLIVVDHLQLMGGASLGESNSVDESRIAEMGNTTRDLKMLASELQCPVIAVAQLNLNVEIRNDKRPVLADLRELGEFEHHADSVMFIYRDDFYNPDSCDPGVAEIIVAKQRNGPPGMVRLAFDKSLARFENLESCASG